MHVTRAMLALGNMSLAGRRAAKGALDGGWRGPPSMYMCVCVHGLCMGLGPPPPNTSAQLARQPWERSPWA